ncbi:MAG: nucleotidyl transferase AbiEii/AbiGii toxin family protein [Kiritimatiellae bacterium]|nr:nucleotidyl transferase AbiEii/AbiGii toxin family protein [Kiritimatiellia bacterium]
MNEIAASIVALNEKLKDAPFDFAFLGGSVLSLLVNDPTVDAIRVTKDIDIVANVRTRTEFHREERELESRGFRHDTREDAPICRWIVDGIVVDVLPVREDVLGWKSPLFEEALQTATTINIEGHSVKVVSPPFFVALKIEAFEDRGKGDFVSSTDFEDVICLFNGRGTLVDEISAEPVVCSKLAEKFAGYLTNPDLEDAVMGFVQTESRPEDRFAAIMSAFHKLANVRMG